MVSLCSHMTDGASSLQRRAFGNRRKEAGGQRVRVALKVAVPLCTGDSIKNKKKVTISKAGPLDCYTGKR